MAHVFIVDDKTLSVHLRYLFAGTGAKDFSCDFLLRPRSNFQSTRERLLVGMIADISRLRVGDDVIFYLQQSKQHEGMFFGSFKVASEPFLASDDYLIDELGKNLTFRVQLMPSKVYENGATERDCLDSLRDISHPYEMCWSLIYRKLKGNRGCTMITDYEFKHIISKIRKNNVGALSDCQGYDYDSNGCKIIDSKCDTFEYKGKKANLGILERLLYKANRKNAYESHLQAYISQNLEKIIPLQVVDGPINWIGNEVSCGVGMQSIDIMFIQKDDKGVHLVVCELKDEQPASYIEKQLKKYVDWINDYLAPTFSKDVFVHPTIVAPTPNGDSIKNISSLIGKKLGRNSEPVRYIAFDIKGKTIDFKEEFNG